jgi:hypothetical protein
MDMRDVEKEHHDQDCDSTNGKAMNFSKSALGQSERCLRRKHILYVETPSPRHMIRERATQ